MHPHEFCVKTELNEGSKTLFYSVEICNVGEARARSNVCKMVPCTLRSQRILQARKQILSQIICTDKKGCIDNYHLDILLLTFDF